MEIDEDGMRQMQEQLWQMLLLVDRAARSAGVAYYLAYGTAIGAAREQGLIAWDPDVDVLVPREGYDRLCQALADTLPAHAKVLRADRDAQYEFMFARVTRTGIDHRLLYLDLFPLVGAPSSAAVQTLYTRVARSLQGALFIKRVDLTTKRHWSRVKKRVVGLVKRVLAPVPGHVLVAAFDRFERRFDRPGSRFVTNSCGSYGRREFFRREWFIQATPSTVRGHELPLPIGNHDVLTQLYGDYMRPVSAEQQQRELAFLSEFILPSLRASGQLS